jgi:hypothetical protein
MTAEMDIRGFSRFVESLQNALIGTGQDGDLLAVCKSEVRQLAMEIAREVGPQNQEAGRKSITKDGKKVFAPGPELAFEAGKRKPAVFETGLTWLYAGPSFLVGVRDEDLQPQMGGDAMRKQFTTQRAAGYPRGKAWTVLGRRGKQSVLRWNRTITSRERFERLVEVMLKRVGRLAAKFAYAAHKLGQNRIPAWVAHHFKDIEQDGSAIFRFTGSGPAFAIEFGARAPGVVSNPLIQRKIHTSIEKRKHILLDKIKKIVMGYTYNWNTGHVFLPRKGEEMMKQLEANEEAFDSLS